MAHTDPIQLNDDYALTPDKLLIIEGWANSAQADYDVATDPEDSARYAGYLAAVSDIVGLLRTD